MRISTVPTFGNVDSSCYVNESDLPLRTNMPAPCTAFTVVVPLTHKSAIGSDAMYFVIDVVVPVQLFLFDAVLASCGHIFGSE